MHHGTSANDLGPLAELTELTPCPAGSCRGLLVSFKLLEATSMDLHQKPSLRKTQEVLAQSSQVKAGINLKSSDKTQRFQRRYHLSMLHDGP